MKWKMRDEHQTIMSSRSARPIRDYEGFSLTEILIATTVLGALAAIGIPMFTVYRTQAEVTKASADMRTLDGAIKFYKSDNGNYPTSLASLPIGNMLDPWGRPYEYLKIEGDATASGKARKDKFLVPVNSDFDLYSKGPDGKSVAPFTAKASHDDIVRANDGGYFGLASEF